MLTVNRQKFAQYILMKYFGFIDVFSAVDSLLLQKYNVIVQKGIFRIIRIKIVIS